VAEGGDFFGTGEGLAASCCSGAGAGIAAAGRRSWRVHRRAQLLQRPHFGDGIALLTDFAKQHDQSCIAPGVNGRGTDGIRIALL